LHRRSITDRVSRRTHSPSWRRSSLRQPSPPGPPRPQWCDRQRRRPASVRRGLRVPWEMTRGHRRRALFAIRCRMTRTAVPAHWPAPLEGRTSSAHLGEHARRGESPINTAHGFRRSSRRQSDPARRCSRPLARIRAPERLPTAQGAPARPGTRLTSQRHCARTRVAALNSPQSAALRAVRTTENLASHRPANAMA